jgi:putative transposase
VSDCELTEKINCQTREMKQKPYWGNHFWARGYFVSTVGIDEDVIKRYVKYQEEEGKRIEEQQHRFDF